MVDARGVPLSIIVTAANHHDVRQLAPTLDALIVPRPAVAPRAQQHLCADAGRHRKKRISNLLVRQILGAPVGNHLRREIRDRNPRGAHVIDTLRYQAKVLLSHSKPLAVGSIFRNTIRAGEHHSRTGRKLRSASVFYDARSFVPQNQWRLRSVILARQDSVVQRRRARGSHPHKHLAIRNIWFRKINQLQIFITVEPSCYHRPHGCPPLSWVAENRVFIWLFADISQRTTDLAVLPAPAALAGDDRARPRNERCEILEKIQWIRIRIAAQ